MSAKNITLMDLVAYGEPDYYTGTSIGAIYHRLNIPEQPVYHGKDLPDEVIIGIFAIIAASAVLFTAGIYGCGKLVLFTYNRVKRWRSYD